MSKTTPGSSQGSAVATDWALDPADAGACERLARTLCTGRYDQVDNPEWVARAGDAWENLPFPLRRGVRRFRRHSGPHGTLVIGGLPVDQAALPAGWASLSPTRLRSPVPSCRTSCPCPGRRASMATPDRCRCPFHTENGFHPHPPDYVIFLCLRADHDQIAGMRVAGIRQEMPLLTPACRQALFTPEFITTPPTCAAPATTAPTTATYSPADQRPVPRVGVHVRGERLPRVLPAFHGRTGQVLRQLLIGESDQHRREDLFSGRSKSEPVHQEHSRRPWDRTVEPHRATTLRDSRQKVVGCRFARPAVAGRSVRSRTTVSP
ncbi:hypothetical protein ABWJ92_36180 [Streptomyces sp. NPDC000609]|uniref:hypothetical protein n=1 Tax=Streptomyces sp. NPDC000609 TaxID=3160957 RepID=UPI003395B797